MTIPENIIYVLDTLTAKGFEAYMVGGCVRDMIMGKIPSDFDITTNALPEDIIKCFPDKNCVLSGMKHGTVAPIINHEAVEITTYRIDGEYKDSRHPEEVYFTKKIEEDLSRRDFTVNAMAMGKDFNVIDPFSGKSDIENKFLVVGFELDGVDEYVNDIKTNKNGAKRLRGKSLYINLLSLYFSHISHNS